ncbi:MULTISPECIES: hypothetical protein [Virgibacillus]|uniref:Uncharacterized protein n=1 Tax=Virgibacillus siamensis TaxID=480071 RepID=A0ABP3R5M8_9BACI|nr:hypothetical protein [Virgibacillus ihumii]
MNLKKIQLIIGLPSGILLLTSLFLDYRIGLFISLGGGLVALIIRQIRLQKYVYMLGHPDRHLSRGDSDDLLEKAETYEIDYREDNK